VERLLDGTQGSPEGVVRAAGRQGRRRPPPATGPVSGYAVCWPSLGRAVFEPVTVTPGPGELVVEVAASIVSSGTERARFLGLPNARIEFPHRPGYAASGRVVAADPAVGGFRPGSEVALLDVPHQSVAAVPPERARLVPPGVDLADAAILQLALVASLGVHRADPRPGEPYGVVGMGLIGALAQRLARLRASGPCVAIAKSRAKQEVAVRGGAARFLAVTEEQDHREIERLGLPVVVEATGDPQALAVAVAAAAHDGMVVLLGSPRGRAALNLIEAARRKRLRLVGAHVAGLTGTPGLDESGVAAMTDGIMRALGSGALQVADLLEEVDPREAAHLYRRLVTDQSLVGVRFDWSQAARRGGGRTAPATRPSRRAPASAVPGRPFRFGFVGCGEIALLNADAIAMAPNATMTACYDVKTELARDLAGRHGAVATPSLHALLERKDVDAVVLAVPHNQHEPIALESILAGKHVVVEKPVAIDLKGALRMVRAAQRFGVALSVCFPDRYGDEVETARQIVRQQGLGDLFMVELLWYADKPLSYKFGGFSGRAPSTWRMWLEAAGGGVLLMNLCHGLDLVHHVTGLGVDYASASIAKFERLGNVEDTCVLNLGYENGALGVIAGSSAARALRHESLRLLGTDGRLELRPAAEVHTSRLMRRLGIEADRRVPLGGPTSSTVARARYFSRFVDAVRSGRAPDVTGEDGLRVQATIEAAYEAARSGARIRPDDLLAAAEPEVASTAPPAENGAGAAPSRLRKLGEVITHRVVPAKWEHEHLV
jgi:predicted dehydrogenase/NADPH:quinone reductase-like Zn-dependent oxidoreductase